MRRLTGSERTEASDRSLARLLAFVAGAVDAGGFVALGQYTSHMSGVVSGMADDLVSGRMQPLFYGCGIVGSFTLGGLITTVLVRWGRARGLGSRYALVLLLEAALLIAFAGTGRAAAGEARLALGLLLCFSMGLQNATVTKLSGSVIRTTHLTGMFTDTGIALGRLLMARIQRCGIPDQPEKTSLGLLLSLIVLFFAGGVAGVAGFRLMGFLFTLPLAAGLCLLSFFPIVDDLRR